MSALPDWTDPLYEAAEMRAADAWAIEEQGVPEADLMERAGLGLARVTASVAAAGPVRIVSAGGTTAAMAGCARLLREDGYEVDVLDGTDRSSARGSRAPAWSGTPCSAPVRGLASRAVASAIGRSPSSTPRGGRDVPSGVNASTARWRSRRCRRS